MLQIKNHKDGKNVIIYCYDDKNKFILILNKKYFSYLVALAEFEKTVNLEPRLFPQLEGYIFIDHVTQDEFYSYLEFQDREDTDTEEYFEAFEMIQDASTVVDNDNFTIDLFIDSKTIKFEFLEDDSNQYDDIEINTDEFISLSPDKTIVEAYKELKDTLNRYDLYCADDEVDLALNDLENAIGFKKEEK